MFRLCTFNIQSERDEGGARWRERRPFVSGWIAREKPDLVATQEGTHSQIEQLASDLTEYEWAGEGSNGGKDGDYNVIFYRRNRFDLKDSGTLWLSDHPDQPGSTTWENDKPKTVTWVRLLDRERALEFEVWNTHFDYYSEAAREKSAWFLSRQIQKRDDRSPPILLVGDFNSPARRSKVYDILVRSGPFQLTAARAEKKGGLKGTHPRDAPPGEDGPRVDWILGRGPWKVTRSAVHKWNGFPIRPSDHYPLVADLEVA